MKRKVIFLKRCTKCMCVSLICASLLLPANYLVLGQTAPTGPSAAQEATIPPEQLESLVAPIALYPDNLLAQVLVASTYPLELVQLQQWLVKNPDLVKDQAKLTSAVQKQSWDASIQAMAPLADTVKWLTDDIQWTTDLGNAFLAQQKDVMDAVQRMRAKAKQKGTLQSGEQISVQTQTVESKEVIVIQQSNPEVIHVPQYDPVVVYGSSYPAYPYPPMYYPPYYGGALAAGAIGFGLGMLAGAAWGGGWGWGSNWGGGDVNINMNNNFNRNTNISGGNRNNINGGKWQHNPSHRGGAPYANQRTADRFGGTTRGDSLTKRQGAAQRDLGNRGGRNDFGNRNDIGGRNDIGDRGGVGNNRNDIGNRGGVGNGRNDIGNRGGLGDSNRGGLGDSSRGGLGGGSSDRIGSRDFQSSPRASDRSSMGGRSDGFSSDRARSSSSRGSSSMSSSRGGFSGGGGSRGGGGFSGGGGRGGGGGRRR